MSKYETRKHRQHELFGEPYRVRITCPFCGTEVVAHVWSMAGTGKKCRECGAIHLWAGSVSRMKTPGIDVQPISDSSSTHGYIAKGYITSEELEAAIRWSWNEEFEIAGLHVAHAIMRCVPTPYTDEYDFMYIDSEPGPGAFECTTVYLD